MTITRSPRNYIKATSFGINPETDRSVLNSKIFFFDERSPDQIREAYEKAVIEQTRFGGKLSFWKHPPVVGPWSHVEVVGQGIGTGEDDDN